MDTRSMTNSLPKLGGPPGYVSSAACKECHVQQYDSWWRSYHRQMTQVVSPATVKADFNNVTMDSGPARFTLRQSPNHYWVDIQSLAEVEAAQQTNGLPPEPLQLPVEMMTGSHYFEVFWTPTGHGNHQIGFPLTWLVAEKHWAPRNDVFIRAPDLAPNPEQWNKICIRCHTTGARPMRDEENKLYDSHVTELGIACEACHGPGESHVAIERKRKRDGKTSQEAAANIVQPAHLDHVRSSQVCGYCHSMKMFEATADWNKNGFAYRPGDDLEKTTPLIRAADFVKQPGITNYMTTHSEDVAGFFWPDGMVRVAGREFNGLTESKCYQKGELACVNCHSMHKSDPDKQIKEGMNGNGACFTCHSQYQKNIAAHTHHGADSSGSLCYNCHMPYTSYGLLRAVRSHVIDRPTVLSTVNTGRPNACNLCHLDKTLKWTAEHLSDWYGQPKPQLAEEDQRVSATVKLLLTGDAAQRALATFALGWQPALAVSGNDWEAPLLATTLEDPYPAIRMIAHRSLTQLPGFADFPYDYDSTVEQRRRTILTALNLWRQRASSLKGRDETLVGPGPTINTDEFALLLSKRDNKPVRIHE
ncbi:MAG TPA: multiheme c-type cytochrome [Verrucomicrobiae bacterium]